MKNLLLSLLLLLIGFGNASAQSASYPLKKASVIVVRTDDSLAVAYNKLARALVAAGYGIEKSDKDIAYIQTIPLATAERKAVSVGTRIALLRQPQCTAIEIRGTYFIDTPLGTPIKNIGQGGSATQAAWNALERVARLYPGGIIAYRVEP